MAKDKNGPEMPSAPAWMLTYGDMVTLLLCFFVLLFAMSSIDVAKFSQVIGVFSGSTSFFTGGEEAVGAGVNKATSRKITKDKQTQKEKSENRKTGKEAEDAKVKEMKTIMAELQKIKKDVSEINGKEGDKNFEAKFDVLRNKKGIVIRLSDTLLFDFGRARIKPEALPVLKKIGDVLKGITNEVVIEGHTDDIPIGKRLRKKVCYELGTVHGARNQCFKVFNFYTYFRI